MQADIKGLTLPSAMMGGDMFKFVCECVWKGGREGGGLLFALENTRFLFFLSTEAIKIQMKNYRSKVWAR